MLLCRNKSRTGQQFWHFLIGKKAPLPAIRITEHPILLTNSEMNRPSNKFAKYFHQKKAVKSHTHYCPHPRI